MSKLFNDPVYKNMSEDEESWLELAIEPYHFKLNDMIAQLPSEVVLDFDFIKSLVMEVRSDVDTYLGSGKSSIVGQIIKSSVDNHRKILSMEMDIITSMYDIKIEPNTVLDLTNQTLNNPIKVVKLKDRIPDDEIPEVLAKLSAYKLSVNSYDKSQSREFIPRINEIMDLMGVTEARSSRSVSKKMGQVRNKLVRIIKNDEWRIRSGEIITSMGSWIQSYITHGNTHALLNFTRLKCMTHKGLPIYSMEEIS